MKKPIKYGADFVRDANWQPVQWTRKQALAYVTKQAKNAAKNHKGVPVFWPVLCDCGNYYRVCLAGQTK